MDNEDAIQCDACKSTIDELKLALVCAVDDCGLTYHQQCVMVKSLSTDDRKAWVCPKCICNAKKVCDNTLTPVGASKKYRDLYVTHRKKVSSATSSPDFARLHGEPNELSSEIRSLKLEMATLRKQLTNAVSLITSYETKLDSYALQVVNLNSKLESFGNNVCATPLSVTVQEKPQVERVVKKLQHTNPVPSKVANPVVARDTVTATAVVPPPPAPGTSSDSSAVTSAVREAAIIEQQWTEVRKRKNRGPSSLCGTAGPTITTLKAVEPVRHLHLWNMASSAEEVLHYLKQLCSTESCTVEELTAKGSYKSYKIGVPAAHYDKCYCIEVWPVNARIKAWINYRKPAALAKVSLNARAPSIGRQSFRGASSS